MIKPVQKRMLAESSMGSAADFFPQKMTLPALKRAAGVCQACPLYREATQTVFGQGPADAPLILVGETPGDQEDLQGNPFVGLPGGCSMKRWRKQA